MPSIRRPDLSYLDPGAEKVIQSLIDIVHAICNTRAERKVESGKLIAATVYAGELSPALAVYAQTIRSLAQVKPLEILNSRHQGGSSDQ